MKFPLALIPSEIIQQYNLQELQHNDWVYMEIVEDMYGLKESGKLTVDQLVEHLAPYDYVPCKHTAGLWKHKTNSIAFVLCVDDFGIKDTNKTNAQDLINTLKNKDEYTENWKGSLYCGIQLDWDYDRCPVDLSMRKYIKHANVYADSNLEDLV